MTDIHQQITAEPPPGNFGFDFDHPAEVNYLLPAYRRVPDRELGSKLLSDGLLVGVEDRASELLKHPADAIVEIGAPIALGYAIPFLPRDPRSVALAGAIGLGLTAVAGFDLIRRGRATLAAINAVNEDNYDSERTIVAQEAGHAVFDYGVAMVGGGIGVTMGAIKRPLEMSLSSFRSGLESAGDYARRATNSDRLVAPILDYQGDVARPGILSDGPELSVYAKTKPAVVRIRTKTAFGTGFLVRDDGLIVTNNHVISGSNWFEVRTADGKYYKANLVARERAADLALLQIIEKPEGVTFPYLELADKASARGDTVLSVGHPTAVVPEVLATGKTQDVYPLFRQFNGGPITRNAFDARSSSQTSLFDESPSGDVLWKMRSSAPVLPGNSGGPMVNMEGKVVGVTHAAVVAETPTYRGIATTAPHLKAFLQAVDAAPPGKGWLSIRTSDSSAMNGDVSAVSTRRVEKVELAERVHKNGFSRSPFPRLNIWPQVLAAPLLPTGGLGIGEWVSRKPDALTLPHPFARRNLQLEYDH